MGKAEQHLYDAFKRARDTGEAWITYQDSRYAGIWRLKLIPLTIPAEGLHGCWAFVRSNRGRRIKMCQLSEKGGLRDASFGGRFQYRDIIVLIAEKHLRQECPDTRPPFLDTQAGKNRCHDL